MSTMRQQADEGGKGDGGGADLGRELEQKLVIKIALGLTVGAGLGWTTVGAIGDFRVDRFLIFIIAFALGGVSLMLSVRNSALARVVLTLGTTATLGLALRWLPGELTPAFTVLPAVAGGAMNPLLGILAAALNSALLYALQPHSSVLWQLITLLWLTAGVQYVSRQGLLTAFDWAWNSQVRANDLLHEARARRGELRRALDSLTEATNRIERTSHELAIAREQAEEARQVKAQFAANISHELRTPLNLIIGFSEIMYRTPEVYGDVTWSPALRADIREIHRSAQHLMGMINDILDLSRAEARRLPLRLEPTDITVVIREAAETVTGLLRGKDVTLASDLPERLPSVLIDRMRIRQVVINLLSNAIRFTDKGTISLRARAGVDEVTVEVADTGVGVPAEQIPVIFEEFGQVPGAITSGRGGAGLGLAICKQYVALHGGRIEAESKVGQGSTFRFTLPLPDSRRSWSDLSFYAPEGWSSAVPENPLGETAVMIAPSIGTVERLAPAIQGFRVVPMQGIDALAETIEREHPAGIVLADLPSVENTLDPERIWKAVGRSDLPVLSYSLPPEEATRKLGITEYLLKPVQRQQLVAAVRRTCPQAARFLVVDDDRGFAAFVSRVLEADFPGAQVYEAYAAEDAVEMIASEPFDVVVLDLVLPGVGGLQVIEAARRLGRLDDLTIVVTTGTGYRSDVTPGELRIELFRRDFRDSANLGRYLSALLRVAPPDYSRPEHRGSPLEAAPESRAS